MRIIIDDEVIKVTQKSNGHMSVISFEPKEGCSIEDLKQYGSEVHYRIKTNKRVSKRALTNGVGFSRSEKELFDLNKIQLKRDYKNPGSYKAIIPYK